MSAIIDFKTFKETGRVAPPPFLAQEQDDRSAARFNVGDRVVNQSDRTRRIGTVIGAHVCGQTGAIHRYLIQYPFSHRWIAPADLDRVVL